MAKTILICGKQASGKTVSLRDLPPEHTFWIDADGKFDQWKGFSKQYNKKNKNYAKTNDMNQILNLMQLIEKQPQIHYLVLDTINSVMTKAEMSNDAPSGNGFQKYKAIGEFGYNIVERGNAMRDNLIIIFVGHTAGNDDGFEELIVTGKKLEKIKLSGYISVVIICRHEDGKYKYIIRSNDSSARVPFGYFEGTDETDNDIMLVLKELEWTDNTETK